MCVCVVGRGRDPWVCGDRDRLGERGRGGAKVAN